jgi:hypothetical protein
MKNSIGLSNGVHVCEGYDRFMAGRKSISVDKVNRGVKFPEFDSRDPLLFELFENLSKSEYENTFEAILHIGSLALLEDRIAHLIESTEKDIFPQLERFKIMFERRKLIFEETAQKKGDNAEDEIVDALNEFATTQGWDDAIVKTGPLKGKLDPPKGVNKTGDVLATIEFTAKDGEALESTTVGIEVKFEKEFPLGDPEEFNVESGKPWDKGFKASDNKTAWSQLLETKANRESPFSIIVFDEQLVSDKVKTMVQDVAYLPGIPGFIVIIDSQSGDFSNLLVTYKIARDMAIHHSRGDLDVDAGVLELIVKRILHYLGDAKKISDKVKEHVTKTIKESAKFNKEVQLLVVHAVEHAKFTEDFLKRYLTTKKLSSVDFAEFYFAHEVAEKLRKANKSEAEFEKQLKEQSTP